MEIKIQSMKFIKPSKSTPEHLRNFKLSLLDQLAPPSYIKILLYYKPSGSDRCTHLIKSLSETLTRFHPLAGGLTNDGLMIDCDDRGVKYTEARVGSRLDDFLEPGPQVELIDRLLGAPDLVETALVAVQVSIFDCGGLVIGVTASHKVTDTFNLVMFVNEWASVNRAGSSAGDGAFCPCSGDLAAVFPPRDVSWLEYSPPPGAAGIVTKRFVFDRTMMSKLRAEAGLSSHRRHSRVALVASLLWKALMSVNRVKSGSSRDCLLAPAMNLRGKAGILVSKNSFGNVWVPYSVWFTRKGTKTEPGFVDLVALVEDTTRDVIADLAEASGEEICRKAMACYGETIDELKRNKFCIFTSWCGFPIYKADFGWGEPCWSSGASRSMEMLALMDDKNGDGIEAWVSLNAKDMFVFEHDKDIIAFTS